MSSDAPITKRLIISGLTPSISVDDISRRLSTFGTVKAADGFGLPDGVGQPRKFGYVTLETTVGKLAKCMNLLSGSTWKGAKLRFGEAKPDFRERIALENQKASEEPPKKKRKRHTSGVLAEDMSLVTPENAAERPGWKVSSLGRITRPIKMRPAHPLVEPQEEKKVKPSAVGKPDKKKKKKVKDPDTRARRRVIDMTKYGSTHLKGVFLDLEVTVPSKKKDEPPMESVDVDTADSSESEAEETPVVAPVANPSRSLPEAPKTIAGPSKLPVQSTPLSPPPPKPSAVQPTSTTVATSAAEAPSDILQEKLQSLNLLSSLFGTAGDGDDWTGYESVGSDIDVDELTKGDVMLVDEDDNPGFEIVPKEGKSVSKSKKTAMHPASAEEDEATMDVEQPSPTMPPPKQQETPAQAQKSTLKDLFAPREEEGGFSLLGHLNADIELDDSIPFLIDEPTQETGQQREPTAPSTLPVHAPPAAAITLQAQPSRAPIVLDPKRPLFFPIPEDSTLNRARQRDIFDIIKDNGWNWRDPAVGFFPSSAPNAEEEIKKRWEEVKGDLTRDWKRRHREALKVSRRKRGGVEDAE
ncbi:hypothetical protein CVT26_003074 [Gymnopilus dilepis]|uniref:RRM domain-containing protein n=1 Tax=Gymnopilus dilepis TaxID=231916 RepID=A0A409Y4U4_9AGAR|nr:hypothetical protein CVT26_003074 [Gymnopilus dilepis]